MPKEYTLIGGNGTRVSPLEVNESGTYEAGDSRAFNPVKVNVPSGSSTLSGLTDVDISNPTDGQTLVYNAATGKWVNGAGGGASLVMPNINITRTGATTGTATCDMTRAAIVSAIENGAICVARITGDTLEPGAYRFAFDVTVFGATEEDEGSVIFTTYDLLGAGDVEWCGIIVLDGSVECAFTRTTSYKP